MVFGPSEKLSKNHRFYKHFADFLGRPHEAEARGISFFNATLECSFEMSRGSAIYLMVRDRPPKLGSGRCVLSIHISLTPVMGFYLLSEIMILRKTLTKSKG